MFAPMTTPHSSPLEPTFAGHAAADIPMPFRRQFLHAADEPHGPSLIGTMRKIWFRPRWIAPVIWVSGKLGVLVPRGGDDVPTRLDVLAGRDGSGRPYHVWKRTFDFPAGPHEFPTTIVYDDEFEDVADIVGPGGFIYLVWRARFHPPATFTLDTLAAAICVGRHKLWLPRWLWPWLLGVVQFRQVARPDDSIGVDIVISHPLLGDFFGYDGTFRVEAVPEAVRAQA